MHPVASMREPGRVDLIKAMITVTFHLRDAVSRAQTDGKLATATGLAEGALGIVDMLFGDDMTPYRVHLLSCKQALRLATAHKDVEVGALFATTVAGIPDHDRHAAVETMKREGKGMQDAIRLAKSEAHRALARMVECFPDAVEREI